MSPLGASVMVRPADDDAAPPLVIDTATDSTYRTLKRAPGWTWSRFWDSGGTVITVVLPLGPRTVTVRADSSTARTVTTASVTLMATASSFVCAATAPQRPNASTARVTACLDFIVVLLVVKIPSSYGKGASDHHRQN